ncbi:MAG: hypothetical protein RSD01_05715 [Ruthenibacterium sp.]
MNRTEFLAALAAKLVDVTDDEREEAIQYYNEYLDEAGSENEESAIAELGTPEKVANIIRANCGFSLKSAPKTPPKPELTLDGPQYDTHKTSDPAPTAPPVRDTSAPGSGYQYDGTPRTNSGNGGNKLILIVLLVFTFPIWIGVLGSLFGIIVGLIATVCALLFAGFAVLIAGIVVFAFSIGQLIASPASGLISMGISLLCIALGALLSAGSLWCICKGAPVAIRAIVNLVKSLLGKVGI